MGGHSLGMTATQALYRHKTEDALRSSITRRTKAHQIPRAARNRRALGYILTVASSEA